MVFLIELSKSREPGQRNSNQLQKQASSPRNGHSLIQRGGLTYKHRVRVQLKTPTSFTKKFPDEIFAAKFLFMVLIVPRERKERDSHT